MLNDFSHKRFGKKKKSGKEKKKKTGRKKEKWMSSPSGLELAPFVSPLL